MPSAELIIWACVRPARGECPVAGGDRRAGDLARRAGCQDRHAGAADPGAGRVDRHTGPAVPHAGRVGRDAAGAGRGVGATPWDGLLEQLYFFAVAGPTRGGGEEVELFEESIPR